MTPSFCHAIAVALVASSIAPVIAQTGEDDARKLSIERIFDSGEFAAEAWSARWLDGSPEYARIEPGDGPSGGSDIVAYAAAAGARRVLVSAEDLVPAKSARPLSIENWELSADRSKLLVYTNSVRVWRRNTRGDYWVLDRTSRELRQVGADAPASSLMFAKLSPDGRSIGYVLSGDIWVEDLATRAARRITRAPSPAVINGTFDWVYEEELGLRDGWRWSPDSSRIAFWQIDTTGVREFPLVNNTDSLYPEIQWIPYPKVGETNSSCRTGVISAFGGDPIWIDAPGDPREHYIARMDWAGTDTLILQQLDRLQNHNRVLYACASHGEVREVHCDTDPAWVEVVDERIWLDGGARFTWISERDGWRHLWIVDPATSEANCVTTGEYDVIELLAADEEREVFWFIASPADATRRYLYKIGFDGQFLARVTPEDAPGTHSYDISPDGRWAIHRFSTAKDPPLVDLVSLPEHRVERVFADNSELRAKLAALDRAPTEFFEVPAGDVELDAWSIAPPGFDPARKYPLLVFVYGEPAGTTVVDQWGGNGYLYHLMLAQQGYFIVSIDNRGTPAPKGRAWRKIVYRQVGVLAPDDQAAAVRRILDERPYLDRERVGVWGWSGGGSMSLNAIFKHPALYTAAIAVAPVPNQRLYDTIYQERYMGLPAHNVDGFRDGSPIHFARQLEGKLLLIHGTGDDNCHYQGTEALIDELIRHGKPFTMMAYPNRSHSIREGVNTTRHLRKLMTAWLRENLPPGPGAAADLASDDGAHVIRDVEGWSVHIDSKLLAGDGADVGAQALKILANELYEIVMRVPEDKLARLREVPIWIDLDHALGSLQYHPSAGWLREHGYDARMEKCVHIPRARGLIELFRSNHQPWVLLHELAHAYHDRVLGFDDARIASAYERAKAAGIYDEVLLNRGAKTRHYALTDPKEFFAELTESYFGTNDFFPFVAKELELHDPETHALLREVWGG